LNAFHREKSMIFFVGRFNWKKTKGMAGTEVLSGSRLNVLHFLFDWGMGHLEGKTLGKIHRSYRASPGYVCQMCRRGHGSP